MCASPIDSLAPLELLQGLTVCQCNLLNAVHASLFQTHSFILPSLLLVLFVSEASFCHIFHTPVHSLSLFSLYFMWGVGVLRQAYLSQIRCTRHSLMQNISSNPFMQTISCVHDQKFTMTFVLRKYINNKKKVWLKATDGLWTNEWAMQSLGHLVPPHTSQHDVCHWLELIFNAHAIVPFIGCMKWTHWPSFSWVLDTVYGTLSHRGEHTY